MSGGVSANAFDQPPSCSCVGELAAENRRLRLERDHALDGIEAAMAGAIEALEQHRAERDRLQELAAQAGRDLDGIRRLMRERLDLIEAMPVEGIEHGISCVRVDTFDEDRWDCAGDCTVLAVEAMSARLCELDDLLEAEARS